MATLTETSEEHGWLFTGTFSVIMCLIWTFLWFAAVGGLQHVRGVIGLPVAGSAVAKVASIDGMLSADERQPACSRSFYLKKLRRMQAYCVIATLAGMAFACDCLAAEDPVLQALVSYGPAQQFFFAMAVGHWIVNVWEDWQTRSLLGQGLTKNSGGGMALFPLNMCCSPHQIMLVMYFVHHVVTAFAYIFALSTGLLGGVMVQGLLFEMPVVFMLRREIAVASDPPPAWLLRPRAVHVHWSLTYLAFAMGRIPATCLWIVSMTSSQHGKLLRHAEGAPLAVYHTLAVFFTCMNVRIVGLLICWHSDDDARATGKLQESSLEQQPKAHSNPVRPDEAPLTPNAELSSPQPEQVGASELLA